MSQAAVKALRTPTPGELRARRRSRIIVTCVLIAPVIMASILWWIMPKSGPRGMGTPPPPNIPERKGKGGESPMRP